MTALSTELSRLTAQCSTLQNLLIDEQTQHKETAQNLSEHITWATEQIQTRDEENANLVLAFNDVSVSDDDFSKLLAKIDVSSKEYSKLKRRIAKL